MSRRSQLRAYVLRPQILRQDEQTPAQHRADNRYPIIAEGS